MYVWRMIRASGLSYELTPLPMASIPNPRGPGEAEPGTPIVKLTGWQIQEAVEQSAEAVRQGGVFGCVFALVRLGSCGKVCVVVRS